MRVYKVDEIDTRGQFHQIFMSIFYMFRYRKCKNRVKLSVFFALLGSVLVKAASNMLIKLTPGADAINISGLLV